jgi:hypothetical protein
MAPLGCAQVLGRTLPLAIIGNVPKLISNQSSLSILDQCSITKIDAPEDKRQQH